MAERRSPVTEIREILRRLQLGERARRIARDLGVSRNTVAHYRRWATRHGLLTGPLPEPARRAALLTIPPALRPAQEQSLVEPFGEQVLAWHAKGVEGQAIWQLLVEQHGFGGSYSSVKRFWRRVTPPTPRATLRLEVDPAMRRRWTSGSAACTGIPRPTDCGAPGSSS
jgi:transposase-like protein